MQALKLMKRSAALVVGVLLLLQSPLTFSVDVAACEQLKKSATFNIRHKISGRYLTPESQGSRDDKRSVEVSPLVGVPDASSRWFFEPVFELAFFAVDPNSSLVATEWFYIHNLLTGLVLTQNPDNNVGIWQRMEVEQSFGLDGSPVLSAQQWRLDTSAEDGSTMIINRASGRGLLQTYGGSRPDKRNVETWQEPENSTPGFSWVLEKAPDASLWQLSIESWSVQKAVSGPPLDYDDVRITVNDRKILPVGDDFYESYGPDGTNRGRSENAQYITPCELGARVQFWDYDSWSGDDLAYTYIIDSTGSILTDQGEPQGGIFGTGDARYALGYQTLPFQAFDPKRPLSVELVIEGEQGLPSYGTVEASGRPVNGFYKNGSSLTLTAVPAELAEFVRWGGESAGKNLAVECGSQQICQIEVAVDTFLQPVFRQMPRLIVENLFGGSTVSFNPEQGTDCSSGGYACRSYETDTEVTMTVNPGLASSEFLRWEGEADPDTGVVDCEDGMVTLTETISCRPVFKRTGYNLRVDKLDPPESIGLESPTTVTSNNLDEINCGDLSCEHTYAVSEGTKFVTLTAVAVPGFTFVGWDGATDCWDENEEDGKLNTAVVTVGARDVGCTAVTLSEDTEFYLTVRKVGGGTVSAAAIPAVDASSFDCNVDSCTLTFPLGTTQIQLTATATRGSKFAGFDTQVGSDTFTGNHEKNICKDGHVDLESDPRIVGVGNGFACTARFNSSVLVVYDSGQSIDKDQNDYISSVQQIGGLDYDFWNVASPSSTSNPDGRDEPNFSDLTDYGRVMWFSGDAKEGSCCGSHGTAGPSLEAEAELAQYLDGGGCMMLSSPEYFNDRGLTDFAQNYLGVSTIVEGADTSSSFDSGLTGTGELTDAFRDLGPYSHRPGNAGLADGQSDTLVHNPNVPGSGPLLRYVDGSSAAVGVDSPVYRSAFLAFPFLALPNGTARHDVMRAFMDFCGQPDVEEDDLFEANNAFDTAYALQGLLAQKDLKRLPGNDDFFHWTATAFSDVTFSIAFAFEDPLSLEIYDSTQSRILEIAGADFNHGWYFVAGVEPGQEFTIRIFGDNDVSSAYSLSISDDGDRDYDGVADSLDGRPDDPDEQFDTDGDSIGDNADNDDDGDGMPDDYELANGFDPLLAQDANLDNDRDGFSNSLEFQENTDPNDPASSPIPEPDPKVTVEPGAGGSGPTAFTLGDGEQTVLSFVVNSDSTDAEIYELTILASGDIDEASDVGLVKLYLDENNDGEAHQFEQVGSGSYTEDDGEITFILAEPFALPIGDTQFLVTYEF